MGTVAVPCSWRTREKCRLKKKPLGPRPLWIGNNGNKNSDEMTSYVRELFVTFAIGLRFVRLLDIILRSQVEGTLVDPAYAYDDDDDAKVDFPTTQVNDTKLFIYRTHDTVSKTTTRLRRFASCRTDDDIMLKVCLHVFTGFCFPFLFLIFLSSFSTA